MVIHQLTRSPNNRRTDFVVHRRKQGLVTPNKQFGGYFPMPFMKLTQLGTKGITARSKDATRGAPGLTISNKDTSRSKGHRY